MRRRAIPRIRSLVKKVKGYAKTPKGVAGNHPNYIAGQAYQRKHAARQIRLNRSAARQAGHGNLRGTALAKKGNAIR